MKYSAFKLNYKLVWAIVISSILLSLAALISIFQQWAVPQVITHSAIILSATAWLIVFGDMTYRKFYHKSLWIIFMVLFPSITPAVYLIQRSKLERIESKLNS
jgi:hypothetical protein